MLRRLLPLALLTLSAHAFAAPKCPSDNAGLTLPDGFCALVAADVRVAGQAALVRHLLVAPNGDVLAALRAPSSGATKSGGFVALRDTDNNGTLDKQAHFGAGHSGAGIALFEGYVYLGLHDAVIRFPWDEAKMTAGKEETVVSGLHRRGGWHSDKTIVITPSGLLLVNIGVPSNACETARDNPKGQEPCPHLEKSGGIWEFDARKTGQVQSDGKRIVTGLRHMLALTLQPGSTRLYGVQNGRDVLHHSWPKLYSAADGDKKPAEEMMHLKRGEDYGWPHCYFDRELQTKVLGPEYGGDGKKAGLCAEKSTPILGFPGHWAPIAIAFDEGRQFPAAYRGGAFVSFHGSWNRSPSNHGGYNVAFVPFHGQLPSGDYSVFADGFAGEHKNPGAAAHRPTGLAFARDGSLYVGEDKAGRIYRVLYKSN